MMDSNNFVFLFYFIISSLSVIYLYLKVENVGVGEREARIYSRLVAKRNFYLGHGIGRSGEINAEQPKAVGSSLLLKLTNYLAMDALKIAGIRVSKVMVLPTATGFTLLNETANS
jgi:O-phospho-L-seryl-tRNASec:L-selenocysteinyl-tRNA synthase